MLLTEEGPFLSPLYDCASAYPYDLESGKWHAAMRIGKTNMFGKVTLEDVREHAEQAGLSYGVCENIFFNIAQGILDHCDEVFSELGIDEPAELKGRMLPQLKRHAQIALSLE